jgi:hypothetical protein
MTELVAQGTWVEIHKIALDAGERSAQVPEDTRQVPLELRVKGFLVADAALGDEAVIETPTGRRLRDRNANGKAPPRQTSGNQSRLQPQLRAAHPRTFHHRRRSARHPP